ALEASSHGLDQHRLDGVRLKAAAFTNLGRDHLDYHPTMQEYLSAKLRLFTELLPVGASAVVNADAEHAGEVAAAARASGRAVLSVGRSGQALRLEAVVRDGLAQKLRVAHGGGRGGLHLSPPPDFPAPDALPPAAPAPRHRQHA